MILGLWWVETNTTFLLVSEIEVQYSSTSVDLFVVFPWQPDEKREWEIVPTSVNSLHIHIYLKLNELCSLFGSAISLLFYVHSFLRALSAHWKTLKDWRVLWTSITVVRCTLDNTQFRCVQLSCHLHFYTEQFHHNFGMLRYLATNVPCSFLDKCVGSWFQKTITTACFVLAPTWSP